MKYEVSILLPGIRNYNWVALYNSISLSTKRSFELIAVGPYDPPEELVAKDNFRFFRDFGHPNRCTQIAATFCDSKYLMWAADDGVFIENTLDESIDILEEKNTKNHVVVCNYSEGGNLQQEHIFKINNAYPSSPYVGENYLIFNVAVMRTEFYKEVGGIDCQFETSALGHADLAVRSQNYGAEVTLLNKPMLNCTHTPGVTGDHAPIHFAHTLHDEGLYKLIYSIPESRKRGKISFDTWKNAESIWKRRFGNRV